MPKAIKTTAATGLVFVLSLTSSTMAAMLNPTGKDVILSMPITSGEGSLGELRMRIAPNDDLSVDASRFVTILASHVTEPHLARVRKFSEYEPFVSKEALESVGYDIKYDPSNLQLSVAWPAAFNQPRTLGQRRRGGSQAKGRAPEGTSAYVNLYAGGSQSGQGDSSTTTTSMTVSGAASLPGLHHTAIESEAHLGADNQLHRDGSRVIFDKPGAGQRWVAGDVSTASLGYLGAQNILGVSLDQGVNTFHRGSRAGRPTGRTSFELERDSVVRIFVNGGLEKTMRLPAGPYELEQLPINFGSNQVLIQVEDAAGVRDLMHFDLFSDSSFMAEGRSEYSLSAGVLREKKDEQIKYGSAPVISGFYRYGAAERLTLAGFGQWAQESIKAGGGVQLATSGGRLSLDSALFRASADGNAEFATNAGWRYDFPLMRQRGMNLFLGASYQSEYFGRQRDESSNEREWDMRLDFSHTLNPHWRWGLGMQSSLYYSGSQSNQLGLRLGYRFRHLQAALETEYETGDEKDVRVDAQLSYRFDRQTSMRAKTNSDHEATLSYNLASQHSGVGSWGLGADFQDTGDERQSMGFTGRYNANRAQWAGTHHRDIQDANGQKSDLSSLSFATSIAYADGKVAIGRPIADSFVILSAHPNLEGRTVYAARDAEGHYEARSGLLGPALSRVQSYQTANVSYDVDDLPLGYNLGSGAAQLAPTYRSGFHQLVGSSGTITLIGKALDPDGEPVKLLTGYAEPVELSDGSEGETFVVFTNSTGRFSAQGLSPGQWRIVLNGNRDDLEYLIDIPDQTVGLWRAGTLLPSNAGHQHQHMPISETQIAGTESQPSKDAENKTPPSPFDSEIEPTKDDPIIEASTSSRGGILGLWDLLRK